MTLPGPADLRSLFTLFLLYDQSTGLEGLIKRIDLKGFDRRRVYRAALGRGPENIALYRTPGDYRAGAHLLEALTGQEFQKGLIKLLLRAFPDRKRVIFVHIPKCAGTDLIARIKDRYPSVNNTITSELWTGKADLFAALKRIVSEIYCSNAIFVYGHISLSWLLSQDLLRFQDDCFTVIRDPLEMVLSHVNYILMRIFAADALAAPDARQWLSILKLEGAPERRSGSEALALARSVLRNQELTPRDVLCRQLGVAASSAEPSASSAVNNLIISNIEITDTTRYDRWSQKKFGTTRATRLNKSEIILRTEDLSAADKEYIASITAEDRKLYSRIVQALNKSESLCIRGGDLNDN